MADFGIIFAGAKNIGPSGVTLVIIRNDLLEQCPSDVQTTLIIKRTQMRIRSIIRRQHLAFTWPTSILLVG